MLVLLLGTISAILNREISIWIYEDGGKKSPENN